jgi:hypothetical protein
MNADPLDALKDIYLPVEPHWWPPAPGWWITAALILAMLWWCGRHFWAYRAATRPIRAAQRMIDSLIAKEATATSNDATLANQCNEVLKRLLVVALGMRTLTNQSGETWLRTLDQLSMTTSFTQGAGSALGEDRFRPQFSANRRALLNCVKQLLNKVHYRKSKAVLEGSA